MTIVIYAASVILGLISLVLFLVAIRHLLGERTDTVAVMLERYDEHLAGFTQTIKDALETSRVDAGGRAAAEPDDPGDVLRRTLEAARARTSTDAAIGIVHRSLGAPTVVAIGLSETETAAVTRLGLPDPGDARAVEISFNSEIAAHDTTHPLRSGLTVSLLEPAGRLAVLTRSAQHRFSDEDVEALQGVVAAASPAIQGSLEAHGAGPAPERDMLTDLFDRQAFYALCSREIFEARSARKPLSLLVVEVDRRSAIDAGLGEAAAERLVEETARRLRGVADDGVIPCRLEGGRFAVLLPDPQGTAVDELFERLRDALEATLPGGAGRVCVSGGAAGHQFGDTPGTLLERAETALRMAKSAGAGTIVSTAPR